MTGTYAYLRARERGDLEVALTPRHSGSVIATAEADGGGRIGVQLHFTGVQRLDANPYRSDERVLSPWSTCWANCRSAAGACSSTRRI